MTTMKTPTTSICTLLLLLTNLLFFGEASWLRRTQQDGDATDLRSGYVTEGLHFDQEGDTKLFVLKNISLGDTILCVTDADEGDIDLFLHFNTPPIADPDGESGVHTCDSIEYTSEEFCVINAKQGDEHSVYVLLRAYTPTQNATLTCGASPTTKLTRGVPVGLSVDRDHDALFKLEVEQGEQVQCVASGEDDIDLYLGRGAIPDPSMMEYDCRSAGSNNQTETCALEAVSEDTTIFVYLDAWGSDVDNAILTCTTVKPLKLDQEQILEMIHLEERIYEIDAELPTKIACWANSSGSLELSMVLDHVPSDNTIYSNSSCYRAGDSKNGGPCLVNAAGDSSVFLKLLFNETTAESAGNVQLLCTAVQNVITPGKTEHVESVLESNEGLLFILPNVPKGSSIDCLATKSPDSAGDLAVSLGFDSVPDTDLGRFDCSTGPEEDEAASEKVCQFYDAPHTGTLYIALRNFGLAGNTSGVELTCSFLEIITLDEELAVGKELLP